MEKRNGPAGKFGGSSALVFCISILKGELLEYIGLVFYLYLPEAMNLLAGFGMEPGTWCVWIALENGILV